MDSETLIAPCPNPACGCVRPRWDCMNDIVWWYCPTCGAAGPGASSRDKARDLWDALPRDDPAAWCELVPVASGRGDATRAEITLEDV